MTAVVDEARAAALELREELMEAHEAAGGAALALRENLRAGPSRELVDSVAELRLLRAEVQAQHRVRVCAF